MLKLPVQVIPKSYAFDFTKSDNLRRSVTNTNSDESTFATEFYINDETVCNSFGKTLKPLYADLIDIALAVYMADRLSPRRETRNAYDGFQWARRFKLKIPVRLPDLWMRRDIRIALEKVLSFFTGDDWGFRFEIDPIPRVSEQQQFLFETPISSPLQVALFSGGLDSFAGAAQSVSEFNYHSFIFVSGATNSRQRSAQREQLRAIRRLSSREICHVTVPFGLSRQGRLRGQGEESSQRSRGFLFLTLGAVTALTAGVSELYIYENGIGAINLPYDATQIGTLNSMSVHPLSLLLMGEFMSILTGSSFSFKNSFLYKTKGQMCQHDSVVRLASLIPTTFSCDGFPVQAKGKPQCGSCTSCLLRRVSLEAAGLSAYDPADGYICDLSNRRLKATDKQMQFLRVMEWQYGKLSQILKSPNTWHNLMIEFSNLRDISSRLGPYTPGREPEVQQLLLQLYNQYVSEWHEFSPRARLKSEIRVA